MTTREEIDVELAKGKIVACYKDFWHFLAATSTTGDYTFYAAGSADRIYVVYLNTNNVWRASYRQFEISANKKTSVSDNATSNTYFPTTKAVADYVSGIVGDINTILDEINGEEI